MCSLTKPGDALWRRSLLGRPTQPVVMPQASRFYILAMLFQHSMTAVVAAEISFLSFSANLLYTAVFSMKSAECQYCWQMGVSSLRTRYLGFTSMDSPQLEQDPGL
jgi:hypothetical protein